ncbi:hypothetical protein DMH04_53805 [Kibdelosporangium aridum]|uniref:Uncharacterized protein n=1 Tax=Kibdelosporangium aridum TaxID=2030 RepID=A0A428Y2J1_KIBAR|nr:hypothetical protein [Kibdelosporangium aridum]RSM61738.1 hypothetical protein DMH04_53805 [Kibdelosporangium aridum]
MTQRHRQIDPIAFIEDIRSSGKVTLVTDEAHPQSKPGVTHYWIELDVQTLINESADPRRTAFAGTAMGRAASAPSSSWGQGALRGVYVGSPGRQALPYRSYIGTSPPSRTQRRSTSAISVRKCLF